MPLCASYSELRKLGPHCTTRKPKRIGREGTPNTAEDDRQARPGKMPEMARACQIRADHLQCYSVTGNWYSPYFLMFGWRPRLPVDLLFLTVNNREWTRTIDEYVKALYERLRECLKLAQESATKEANRQKRLYDRRVGAVELHPGDRVLVCLDAFQGQRRKLKNRWGDDIHTVIDQKADGIPVYEVKNECTGKKKVLHQLGSCSGLPTTASW